MKLVVEKEMPVFYGVFGTLVEAAGERHADRGGEALRKRTGGHIDADSLVHIAMAGQASQARALVLYLTASASSGIPCSEPRLS